MNIKPNIFCVFWILLAGVPLFAGTNNLISGNIYLKEFFFKVLLFSSTSVACIYLLASRSFKNLLLQGDLFDIVIILYFLYLITRYFASGTNYFDYITILLPTWVFVLFSRQLIRQYVEEITFKIILSIIVLTIIQATIALLQWFHFSKSWNSNLPMTGTFHNSGPLGLWMAISIPCCFFFLQQQRLLFKGLAIGCLLLAVTVIILSESRTAIMASIAGTAYYYRLNLRGLLKRPIVAGICLGLAGGALIYFFLSFKIDSALGRISVWKVCLAMIKDSPVTGLGLNGFIDNYYYYLLKNIATIRPELVDYAFNDLLQLTVEQGIVGLAFFATIIALLLFKVNISPRINSVKTLIVIIMVGSLTSYPFEVVSIWGIFITAVILVSVASFKNTQRLIPVPHYSKIIVLLLFSFLCAWLTVQEVNIFRSKAIATTADKDLRNEQFESAIKNFRLAMAVTNYDKRVYLGYANALQQGGYPDSSLRILTRYNKTCDPFSFILHANIYKQKKDPEKAETNYRSAMQLQANMLYPKYLLLNLYYESGQYCKAYHMANEVLNFKARIPSSAIDEMKSEALVTLSILQEQPKLIYECK